MPKRPQVRSTKFGKWLELQRQGRSFGEIAQQVRHHVEATGLKVSPSLIHKIEAGRVPSWPMLGAFAHVYAVSIEEVLRQLTEALDFPGASDLLRHGRTGQSNSHQIGGVDGPAQTRIRELQDRVDQLERLVPEIEGVLVKLAGIAGDSVVVRKARKPQSGKGGSRKKTA